MTTNKDALENLTPGQLFALLSGRRSPIDPNKSISELSYGELLMLEQHSDFLEQYKRERKKILMSEMSSEESDYISEGELIQRLYGRKQRTI